MNALKVLKPSTQITLAVFVLAYAAFALQFPSLLTPRVVGNLLTDGSYLGILAVGMLMVVISGGIDLSVGAVMTFTSVFIAVAISQWGIDPLAVFGLALIGGTLFGAGVGAAIRILDAPPFIVTLTAMFLARGGAILLSQESVSINHPLYASLARLALPLPGGGALSLGGMIMVLAFVVGGVLLHHTRFGLRVFALGGDRRAAELLGASVGRTTVQVYAFSGFMAALAGVVYSLYTGAGYALSGIGIELEAIAAVVIGGAMLSGGVGGITGAFFGVMIQGLILTYITFSGNFSSWWTKIIIGLLVLAFLLAQRFLSTRRSPVRAA